MGTSHHQYTGNTMYSSICIEVDEFKFYKVIQNVLVKSWKKLSGEDETNLDSSYGEESIKEAPEEAEEGKGLSWLDNTEVYEVLDASGMESVGFREFCALIFLVAAAESQQLLKCLHSHQVLFFDIVAGGQQQITSERAKTLGRMLGLSEALIDSASDEIFELTESTLMQFEDFQLFYFELFSRLEQNGFENLDQLEG